MDLNNLASGYAAEEQERGSADRRLSKELALWCRAVHRRIAARVNAETARDVKEAEDLGQDAASFMLDTARAEEWDVDELPRWNLAEIPLQ